MPSSYPNSLDSFSTNRADNTPQATTHATEHNNTNDAINKIEGELGVTPKGTDATVAARLSRIDTALTAGATNKVSLSTAVGDSSVQVTGAIPAEMQAGQCVAIGAFTTNCEIRKITSVSSNTLTLTDAKSVSATTISFDGPTKTIASTAALNGYFVGSKVVVTGSASNNSTFTVTAVSSDLKTLTVSETVTTEAAGANVTLKIRLNVAHNSGERVLPLSGGVFPAEIYGVKASNSTSDAGANLAALQRASNEYYWASQGTAPALGYGGIRFAAGTTYINGEWFPEHGMTVEGSSADISILKLTGSSFSTNEQAILHVRRAGDPCVYATPGPSTRVFLRNFLIDGNNITGANGILASVQQPGYWDSIRVINCPGYGIAICDTQQHVMRNIELTANGTALTYQSAEFVWVDGLNIEQSTTTDFTAVAQSGGVSCDHNHFIGVHLESAIGAGGKFFDIQSGDGWMFKNVWCSNADNTATLFNFNFVSGLGGKPVFILENIRCNQPSTSFKVVNDVQRSQSLTPTAVNRTIQRLESGIGTARWAYLLAGNNSGGTSGPPEFMNGIKTSVQTSGALGSIGLTSGVGAQLSTTRDVFYTLIIQMNPTAANTATCTVALSPYNVTYTQFINEQMPAGSGITTGNFLRCFGFPVPAGWYVKCTVTNATIGGSGGILW